VRFLRYNEYEEDMVEMGSPVAGVGD
jgi:hypothetical protein